MQSLSLHSSSEKSAHTDLAQEIARLEALLMERKLELVALQEELRAFRELYTQLIGSRLAELAEVERAIKEAERHALGIDASVDEEGEASAHEAEDAAASHPLPVKTSLRKLFWAVARMFHPDHASDEGEARRRHSIMAEASRAYQEGDVESLHTLLGDEELRSYCASAHGAEEEEDKAARLLNLREELRTVEYGIKRIRQDGLYRLKLSSDEEALQGRDALVAQAAQLDRQITKARRRLEHLS
ncbi:MAG TPA: hypothetical protein VM911_02240 [Pyrinomonadaceae bacterium]|jgi:hypothetical protein|nr:hypothetical protein [Pyrinomonadaceae bacterium]